ncbi:MAG: hypothetical protein E5Y04_30700 [Mesorhizobium sp.]|nr:MAG: hypothetical protein E5Y04_30700 [Mesorhizobium sp.]
METLNVCIAAFNASDLTKCAPIGLSLEAWATILGMSTLAVLSLILRGFRLSFLGFTKFVSKAATQVRTLMFGSNEYPALCRAVWPLMEDNRRIFEDFGPKSGANHDYVRFDQTLWKASKNKIVENNRVIAELIRTGAKKIPTEDKISFDRWLSHIDAFEAHVENEAVDYRHNQFPKEVVDIVSRHA